MIRWGGAVLACAVGLGAAAEAAPPWQQAPGGLLWQGAEEQLTFRKLAALAGPVLWFSPDEPLLKRKSGTDIDIPTAFPFERPGDGPVLYYRVSRIVTRPGAEAKVFSRHRGDVNLSRVSLRHAVGIELDYWHYYPFDVGKGGHNHDLEGVHIKLSVEPRGRAGFAIRIMSATGDAHGVEWYANTLDIDEETRLPLTILVEEGKHASCTDNNADGIYTPNYDVTRRKNDAWGVRDTIRSGLLGSGEYEGWMSKVRPDEYRVFPPLPSGSVARDNLQGWERAAVYDLRPYPSSQLALPDKKLHRMMYTKGVPRWPEVDGVGTFESLAEWIGTEDFVRSISFAYRYDGRTGVVMSLPFWIVGNLEEPFAGGYLVHRLIWTDLGEDFKLMDFGYQLLYSPSASRWVDGYFAVGTDYRRLSSTRGARVHEVDPTVESGLKFRFNLKDTPLRFLGRITDFWGVRAGIQNRGAMNIENFRYVLEIGAGAF